MREVQTPEQRLREVAESSSLQWHAEPRLIESHSNDTWLFDEPSRGPVVLRIGWRGDRGRLVTEAKVGRALPSAVGYPEVLGFGWTRDEADLTWSMTRRLQGRTLAQVWPELSETQRHAACVATADLLTAMHQWRPSGAISDRLLSWAYADSVDGIVGATLNPLPLERAEQLAAGADLLAPEVAEQLPVALDWLRAHRHLAPALDRPGLAVTHQDLHLGQIWWDGERVSGLLDLEWVRWAPAWTDLGRVADNVLSDEVEGLAGHRELFEVLRARLEPSVDDLDACLRYWRVAFAVRELYVWPYEPPVPADHPIHVIDALVAAV